MAHQRSLAFRPALAYRRSKRQKRLLNTLSGFLVAGIPITAFTVSTVVVSGSRLRLPHDFTERLPVDSPSPAWQLGLVLGLITAGCAMWIAYMSVPDPPIVHWNWVLNGIAIIVLFGMIPIGMVICAAAAHEFGEIWLFLLPLGQLVSFIWLCAKTA